MGLKSLGWNCIYWVYGSQEPEVDFCKQCNELLYTTTDEEFLD
jgi:hypothetical protein